MAFQQIFACRKHPQGREDHQGSKCVRFDVAELPHKTCPLKATAYIFIVWQWNLLADNKST